MDVTFILPLVGAVLVTVVFDDSSPLNVDHVAASQCSAVVVGDWNIERGFRKIALQDQQSQKALAPRLGPLSYAGQSPSKRRSAATMKAFKPLRKRINCRKWPNVQRVENDGIKYEVIANRNQLRATAARQAKATCPLRRRFESRAAGCLSTLHDSIDGPLSRPSAARAGEQHSRRAAVHSSQTLLEGALPTTGLPSSG